MTSVAQREHTSVDTTPARVELASLHHGAAFSITSVDPALFKAAMRATCASVNVITSAENGRFYGLTATAFSSVCAEPPTVIICVNNSASAAGPITRSGAFCVNVLQRDMRDVADECAGKVKPEDRFKSSAWQPQGSGALMVKDAVAAFECRVTEVVEIGSHSLVVGQVVACHQSAGEALLYKGGAYGEFQTL